MSYEMSVLRKEDLSLYIYIKDVVLRRFVEEVDFSPLDLVEEMSIDGNYVYAAVPLDRSPEPFERGRGMLYFDLPDSQYTCTISPTVSGFNGDGDIAYGVPEQSNKVYLYETTSSGIVEVSWIDYMIDYTDCRIITKRQLNEPYLSYKWNYVSVVDEWGYVTSANPPVVVVDISSTSKEGYQLGGGKSTTRRVDLHVFASNQAERNDITEALYDGLYNKSCALYDFRSGTVLDFDGTFYGRKHLQDRIPTPVDKTGYLFDNTEVTGISSIKFENVSARNVRMYPIMSSENDNTTLSDLNAYRATVSLDIQTYDDRTVQ